MQWLLWKAFLIISGTAATFAVGCSKSDPVAANIPGGDDSTAGGSPGTGGSAPQKRNTDALHPVVAIRTSLGEITVKLDAELAPITVDNFLTYAKSGQYNGTIFHSVDRGFIALGGGFTPDLQEKPVQLPIRNEAHNGLKNRRGTIAMSRNPEAIDSASCQFFINLADNPSLDFKGRETAAEYGYCVFGEVVSGQDVLDRLDKAEVKSQPQFDKLPVESITIKAVQQTK